jgi:hypothetical protein
MLLSGAVLRCTSAAAGRRALHASKSERRPCYEDTHGSVYSISVCLRTVVSPAGADLLACNWASIAWRQAQPGTLLGQQCRMGCVTEHICRVNQRLTLLKWRCVSCQPFLYSAGGKATSEWRTVKCMLCDIVRVATYVADLCKQ